MINMQGKSVLIVDDSASMIRKLESLYQSMNMHIRGTAKNGVEALEQIERLKPDLVSLDIVMPVMDGIECYRQAIKKFLDTKFIFVSCMAGDARIVEAFAEEIPAHLFVPKFPTAETLGQCLEKVFPGAVKRTDINPNSMLRRSA